MSSCIALLNGGGMDSLVVLGMLAETYPGNIVSVHYDYGQKAARPEEAAVRQMSEHYGSLFGGSMRIRPIAGSTMTTGDPVNWTLPHYVPQRNLILLATTAAWMQHNRITQVAGGWQAGDTQCPDVQMGWLPLAGQAIREGGFPEFEILIPLGLFSKDSVIEMGDSLGVPWDLSWSCFNEGPGICGTCVGCERRQLAFERYMHRPDQGIRTRQLVEVG